MMQSGNELDLGERPPPKRIPSVLGALAVLRVVPAFSQLAPIRMAKSPCLVPPVSRGHAVPPCSGRTESEGDRVTLQHLVTMEEQKDQAVLTLAIRRVQ